jgi:hypothetical protein
MKTFLVLLISFSHFIGIAQTVDFYGKTIDTKNICQSLSFNDNKEAKTYLDTICNSIGIKSNFIMAPCGNIGTCLATIVNGDPYILYDNAFLTEIKKSALGFTEKKIKSNTDKFNWQYLTILAHELGHFQNNHFSPLIRKTFTNNQLELQADEYAGFVISKLGGTIEQGKQIYNSSIISVNQTLEHPSKKDRIDAYEKGFKKEYLKSSQNQNSNNESAFKSDENIVQIPAQFPGGVGAWQKYLSQNLNDQIATKNGAPEGRYLVIIKFKISANGEISETSVENDPGYGTKDELIRILKQSPKWIPAIQNGRNVPYYHKQSITFVVGK